MTLTIEKPTVGGSADTWGTTINTALDDITAAVNTNIFPTGGIIMWSGSIASIPSGWNLCDGTNSTPDLRNRFVVGAGDTYSPDDTGGEDSVTLTESQMPSHSHSGSTGSAGSHSHSASTGTAGNHRHLEYHYHYNGSGDGPGPASGCCGGAIEHSNVYTGYEGDHSHSVSISSAGSHSHSVTVGDTGGDASHENRPPYYALAYIMKT